MSVTTTIHNPLILQENTGGNTVIKPSLNVAYGPHANLTVAQSAIEAAFETLNDVPKGYTFCVLEDNKPVEYWFIVDGDTASSASFIQRIEKKQKEATVDLSDLSFRTVTEDSTTYLEVSTDGINYTRVGTLPTSSGDINQIKVRVCEDPGSNYGKIQISYQNGTTGSWQNVGDRDDSRLKPLTDLHLFVDANGQLRVDYSNGAPAQIVDGAVFDFGSIGEANSLCFLDYHNAPEVQYEGQTYSGQGSVNAFVNAAIDSPVQFNVWMNQQYGGMPKGTRVIFVSTLPNKVAGISPTDPDYYYILYSSIKVSETSWAGLSWVGRIKKEHYNAVPFNVTISPTPSYDASRQYANPYILYEWDHGSESTSGTAHHESLTLGASFTVDAAVPFRLYIPTTKDDSNNSFFIIKRNGIAVTDGESFEIGNYQFTIDVPQELTEQEFKFDTGGGAGTVANPAYYGLIGLVAQDETITNYYGSIELIYQPYISTASENNYVTLWIKPLDRNSGTIITNAEVYKGSTLLGRTDYMGKFTLSTKKNVSVQCTVKAEGYEDTTVTDDASETADVAVYLNPSIPNSAVLKLNISPKSNFNVWLDDEKQLWQSGSNNLSGVIKNGVLERRVSIGDHTVRIVAENYEPYGPTVISVPAENKEEDIVMEYLGDLTYLCTVSQVSPLVSRSGGTGNVELEVVDSRGIPCIISKVVPADSYDDFNVNSLVRDPETGKYTANITFAPLAETASGTGVVGAFVYYVGSDGTTVSNTNKALRMHTKYLYPYVSE